MVETLIKAIGIDFRIGGDRAFYVPSADYASAGVLRADRLGTDGLHVVIRLASTAICWAPSASRKYAFEELIAETSAAFCCASLGIVPTVRHADYLGSWLECLRERQSRVLARPPPRPLAQDRLQSPQALSRPRR